MVLENDETESPPEPAERKSLIDVLAALDDLDEDVPEMEDPPPEPVDPFNAASSPATPERRR